MIPLAKQTMGKKKKGKKKKKKAAGGDTGTAELIPFDLTDTRRYVHVSMHMENWTFAERLWPKDGFWIETKTRLFIVHKMIKKRHGAVQNIRIWKSKRSQENLLLGEMKTMYDLGFNGEVRPQDRPRLEPVSGSPPATADSTAGGGDGDGDGVGADSNATTFEDGMVASEEKNSGGEESKDNNSANDTRPNTGATDFSDVAPEDDYEHIRLIYDFTPKNLDDPLLLISPRV